MVDLASRRGSYQYGQLGVGSMTWITYEYRTRQRKLNQQATTHLRKSVQCNSTALPPLLCGSHTSKVDLLPKDLADIAQRRL